MAIALAISGKPVLEVDAETITIGSDPAGTIALTDDDRVKPRHAVIRRVAGRWLVEASEGDSIQVGDSEPARVHWLNAGDVIHLIENGPEITFQPPRQEGAASVVPLIPAAPTPLAAPIGPAAKMDLPPLFDSLFEPIAKTGVTPIPPPRVPALWETPAVSPSRQPDARKRRENGPSPKKIKPVEIAGLNPQPVAEELSVRPLPRLQREGASLSRSRTTSEATFGWVFIWVAVGLGALLVVAVIWFGSGAANGDDHMPQIPATRLN
jgi:hypothetical protein